MDPRFAFSRFAGSQIHLGVCGSVAAYKSVELLRMYQAMGASVSVTLTPSAMRFITPLLFSSLGAEKVYTEMFDGSDAEFGHLAPGAAADIFVIAPATATTMARLCAGLADDMLAAQCLAFGGPLLLAPAMNPRMWKHPATRENVRVLAERGAMFVGPAKGQVACGDDGTGKLASLDEIFLHTLRALSPQDLSGQKVMLTIGPTREPWDGVRFWSNPSTGLMGSALAVTAWLRGAEVHAITGPGVKGLPAGINNYPVGTALEMYEQAWKLWPDMDMGLFTAAVADFSPIRFGEDKFKKTGQSGPLMVSFSPNKDIIAELAKQKQTGQKVLGFAAETKDLEQQVASKLERKQADMIVGNYVNTEGAGFGSVKNSAYVLDRKGEHQYLSDLSKPDLAWRLLDWLLTL